MGGSSVYSIVPKTETGIALRESVLLGTIHCSRRELQQDIGDISSEFHINLNFSKSLSLSPATTTSSAETATTSATHSASTS
jgi:hypothetical protein